MDEARLERLHREHAGAVRAFVRRRIDGDEVDEVVAEVFVIAWRRLEDERDQTRVWLLGVARRVVANRRRAAKRQRALYERLAREAEGAAAAARDPAAVVTDGTVLRALAALSPGDREVLLLITWDGLGHAEAAAVLGLRRAAFSQRVRRARRRLACLMEAPDPPPAPEAAYAAATPPQSVSVTSSSPGAGR